MNGIMCENEASGRMKLSGLDRWGVAISSLCLVHCLALPLIATLLPFMAISIPGEQWVHSLLLGIALPVSGTALFKGYRRHRLRLPAMFGLAGMTLLACAILAGGEVAERVLTVAGGLLIATAHLLNLRSHKAD